jgi:hypothetical protein
VREPLAEVRRQVEVLRTLNGLLDPATGSTKKRALRFDALATELEANPDPAHAHMARVMRSFRPGLFVGGKDATLPRDNLDLERFFRLPKGHERRIHGHAHAGIRIVLRGPALLMVLDAHQRHPEPFSGTELAPWLTAKASPIFMACQRRTRIMRRARSTKSRKALLADLERRFESTCFLPS